MRILRAISRLILLFLFLVAHISWVVILAMFRGPDLQRALSIRQFWVKRILRMLGVVIDKHSEPPSGHHLYIGNHRSYIDPIVALLDVKALPVAKAEVADWPVIGYGAKVTGIMYVKRESKSSRAAVLAAMRETLNLGFSVLVYPEGTTHVLATTIDFRTGAFNMAAKEGFTIVPMAIDYADLRDSFIGNDTFVPHFLRCFGKPRTYVKIRYGKPIKSDNVEEMVRTAKEWIDENMLIIRQEFDAEKISRTSPALAAS